MEEGMVAMMRDRDCDCYRRPEGWRILFTVKS